MGIETALFITAVALGSALIFVLRNLPVIMLCLKAMREGSDFEGEIRHHLTTFRVRVSRSGSKITRDYAGHSDNQQHVRRTGRRN